MNRNRKKALNSLLYFTFRLAPQDKNTPPKAPTESRESSNRIERSPTNMRRTLNRFDKIAIDQ